MKVDCCDVCLAQGNLVKSKYRTGFVGLAKVSVCPNHRQEFRSLTRQQFLDKYLNLMNNVNSAGVIGVMV